MVKTMSHFWSFRSFVHPVVQRVNIQVCCCFVGLEIEVSALRECRTTALDHFPTLERNGSHYVVQAAP